LGGTRRPAWQLFVGISVVLLVALDRGATVLGMPISVHSMIFAVTSLTVAGAILVGVRRHRPAARGAWWLFAAAQVIHAAAHVVVAGGHVFGQGNFPGPADILFLAQYVPIVAGLVVLVRRRTPGRDLPSLIDAGIVAVSSTLLAWVFFIGAQAASGPTLAASLVSGAFPTMDLLLIVVGARLVLGVGGWASALRLIGAYLLVLLVADLGFMLEIMAGSYYQLGGWTDLLWTSSALLLGAAALHPSMNQIDQRAAASSPDVTNGRLALLAATSLLAPATLVIQDLRGANLHVLLVAGCCGILFLLVVARLASVVAVQRHAAVTDPLTGLRTRRYFEEAMATETHQATRDGSPLSLLIVDLDYFKSVNDTHGHDGGDRVLREVSRRMLGLLRAGDVLARYGGEEFAVLLPRASTADACRIAERIRSAVAGTPINVTDETAIAVTLSAGVATMPTSATSGKDLLLKADQLLYQSKANGRNRVTAPQESVSRPR
jgi:two-component system cell cycle response regulator